MLIQVFDYYDWCNLKETFHNLYIYFFFKKDFTIFFEVARHKKFTIEQIFQFFCLLVERIILIKCLTRIILVIFCKDLIICFPLTIKEF